MFCLFFFYANSGKTLPRSYFRAEMHNSNEDGKATGLIIIIIIIITEAALNPRFLLTTTTLTLNKKRCKTTQVTKFNYQHPWSRETNTNWKISIGEYTITRYKLKLCYKPDVAKRHSGFYVLYVFFQITFEGLNKNAANILSNWNHVAA